MAGALQIRLAAKATDDIRDLIGELNDELEMCYAPEQRHGLALDAIFQPHIRFFIAQLDGVAAGCGGVAIFEDFAEIKRMFVRPALRGRGIADAIMAALIAETAKAGLPLLRLETGIHQHAALVFYRRSGFGDCAAFPPYSGMSPAAIHTSVFMERRLA
ncbi:MAG TPA: GNAT family N-acetyltransferase [Rhizomicrobium sp.]|nr:GNAT family N-acetyltransferase [Rhizomicrobium sp.]